MKFPYTSNMNNTVGEIEQLTTYQYTLGVVLLLSFLTVSILNGFLLLSFYNLRHFPFVQNTMAMISIMVTDLVNSLLLIPTLLSWYLVSPPHSYGECVFKSFPFMLTNFTSLLSITVFCVHRLMVMKKITVGEIKVRTKYCGMATCLVWLIAVFGVSVPYIVWNSSGVKLLDCRRALFSNIQFSLVYFAVLFDIPLVIMNVTLVLLIILFMKYRARVGALPNTEMAIDKTGKLNGRSVRVKAFSVGSDTDDFGDLDKEDDSTFGVVQIQTVSECVPRTSSSVDISNQLCEGNRHISARINLSNRENLFVQTRHTATFDLPHVDFNGEMNDIVSEKKLNQNRNQVKTQGTAVSEYGKCTGLQNERELGNHLGNQNISTRTSAGREYTPSSGVTNDLKQFLVTMGVLVVVYDATILPLLFDLTLGGISPSVTIPHALNSLCFLNSFCSPIVYLIRMGKVRREMKRLASTCWCKKNARR